MRAVTRGALLALALGLSATVSAQGATKFWCIAPSGGTNGQFVTCETAAECVCPTNYTLFVPPNYPPSFGGSGAPPSKG